MRGRSYFKGWYFKCSTDAQTIALIPACHRSRDGSSASLQVITDDAAYHIPFDALAYSERPLSIRIGACSFSEQGVTLRLHDGKLKLEGTLRFRSLTPIAYDIMGPFALVPFMQCRHSVYSMTHSVDGQITVNDRRFDFHNGVGYIEGDSGRSFPNRYIWTQCGFANGALMLSVADIPMLGCHFTGIIGVVWLDGREYRIATYLGARVEHIDANSVTVKQGAYTLTATLLQTNAQPLFAPEKGSMCRTIHESAACVARYRFVCGERVLCEFVGDQAGFEFEW